MNTEEQDTIEGMIDRHGLKVVATAIAEICFEKSEHVLTNWNDEVLAEYWQRAGSRMETFAEKIQVD